MKVGVVGLLSGQSFVIRNEFKELDLEFLPREREREVGALAGRCSKVILMKKFISHQSQNAVPTHKRVLIDGGMTKLRLWLNTHQPVKTTTAAKKPINVDAFFEANGGKIDWSPLTTAKVDDVLAFKRPSTLSRKKWEQNVSSIRSYYARAHGVKTTATTDEQFAYLTVRKAKEEQQAPLPKPADEVVSVVCRGAAERSFWEAALVARLSTSMTLAEAIADADAAMGALHERFLKG